MELSMCLSWFSACVIAVSILTPYSSALENDRENPTSQAEELYTIEGKLVYVKSQDTKSVDSLRTKIAADGSEYYGFLSEDRESFIISGVPPGSYLIEVYHPECIFESARVDISSKGKFRARRPDILDGSAAAQNQLPYPLKLKLLRRASYFQAKEAWRLTDMLMNPMVLMMILPLVVLMVIPKMLSTVDPEATKELQSSMAMASQPPDMSQLMANFFGGAPAKPAPATRKTEKREKRRE
ncbi:ER membrane protein complex subunit 7 homolog [Paramacrobiotus metropolitanus]|uniref:ER membrane protein complex subunit 7 homolog n=1 Tax=Paramacrobiotus metropolitanus TaxID=2943436 RepID=UPI0024464CE4|nr:ER membrane protein complex subunit 7 homolog [Paramacrobiotus metropolitanus]